MQYFKKKGLKHFKHESLNPYKTFQRKNEGFKKTIRYNIAHGGKQQGYNRYKWSQYWRVIININIKIIKSMKNKKNYINYKEKINNTKKGNKI